MEGGQTNGPRATSLFEISSGRGTCSIFHTHKPGDGGGSGAAAAPQRVDAVAENISSLSPRLQIHGVFGDRTATVTLPTPVLCQGAAPSSAPPVSSVTRPVPAPAATAGTPPPPPPPPPPSQAVDTTSALLGSIVAHSVSAETNLLYSNLNVHLQKGKQRAKKLHADDDSAFEDYRYVFQPSLSAPNQEQRHMRRMVSDLLNGISLESSPYADGIFCPHRKFNTGM